MNQKEKEYSLYAAYGLNINPCQMRERCPDSQFVQAGILENYRFVFATSKENGTDCVANIVSAQGEETPIAIYTVSKSNLLRLDEKEGRIVNCKGEETGKYHRVNKRAKGLDEDLICYVLDKKHESNPAIGIRIRNGCCYADTIIRGLEARKMGTCHVYRAMNEVKSERRRLNCRQCGLDSK